MLAARAPRSILRSHVYLRPFVSVSTSTFSPPSLVPHTTARQFSSSSRRSNQKTMAPNDPYTAKAEQDASVEQKKSELESIIKESKFSMLTSRDSNGDLHSRAMSPASHQGLVFTFVANRDSGKFDELANDSNVNVSFSDPSSTDWASVAGNAKINTDVEAIKKVWSPLLKSWFGKIDSTKTGEPGDPRIALIEVIPTEIRYWVKTRTSIGQTFEVVKGAITGETAAPGALRTITSSELELARQVANKQV